MAKRNQLTARTVAAATKAGSPYLDGEGLRLLVSETGAKKWVLRFTRLGRTRDLGLGAYPQISLSDAREAAAAARRQLATGQDPIEQRRRERATTFGACADRYMKAHAGSWRHPKTEAQWTHSLTVDCAALRNKPIAEVETADVLEVLQPVWSKRESALRLRGRIESVIDAARALGDFPPNKANPARWRNHLDHLLPGRPKGERKHHPAIKYETAPALIAKLRASEATSALLIEYLALTAARSGEGRGMTWNEVDFAASLWTIPGPRMKAGREHRVPLSAPAMAILERLRKHKTGDLVFAGRVHGKPLAQSLLARTLARHAGAGVSVHGWRTAFRNFAAERTTFPREVAELCLAHQVGDETERAYSRSELMEKRRSLLESWGAYLEGEHGSKVIPLRRA